jgi:hypothetical protein
MLEFASPAMLWASAALAIPVLIHLFFRHRFRNVEWAAMSFLRTAALQRRRHIVLQDLLLLFVRILAVALLVMTFARPVLKSPLPGLAILGEGGVDVHLLVDDSASMSRRVAEGILFTRARKAALSVVETLAASGRSARVTVSVASNPEPLWRTDALVPSGVERLREAFGQVEPAATAFDAGYWLAELRRRAGQRPDAGRLFYLLTDLQASNWADENGALLTPVAESLRALQESGSVVVVDVGAGESPNAGIARVRAAEPVAFAGQPFTCLVTLDNQRGVELPPGRLMLTVDGAALPPVATPAVPPGDSRELPVTVLLGDGWHGLEFRLASNDVFPADDAAFLAVRSRANLPVLVVEGAPGLRASEGSAFYLTAALSPAQEDPGGIRVVTLTPAAAAETALSDFAVVILSNVADPTQMLPVLRRYVAEGGGLVVFLGDRADAERWNASLLHPDSGLIPARLTGVVVSDAEEGIGIGALDLSSPFLEPFRPLETLFSAIHVRQRWGVEALGDTSVIAAFNAPAMPPAMLHRRLGRGGVLLVATGADDRWSDWPRSDAGRVTYVPFFNHAIEVLAAGESEELNLTAGSVLELRLDLARHRREALLRAPPREVGQNDIITELHAAPLDGRPGLWFLSGPLLRHGLWMLHLYRADDGQETVYAAVNLPAAERDLRHVQEQVVQRESLGAGRLQVLRYDAPALSRVGTVQRGWWKTIAQVLFLVLLVESGIALLFGGPRSGTRNA